MNELMQTAPDRSYKSSVRWSSKGCVAIVAASFFVLACSAQQGQRQSNAVAASSSFSETSTDADKRSAPAGSLPLRTLSDVPLTGGTTRLDYQSLDSENGRLYIAHLGSDLMTVFDVNKQTFVGDVKDLKRVHGVLAVPERHRVYASATGTNELAIIDDQTLRSSRARLLEIIQMELPMRARSIRFTFLTYAAKLTR
jgi:hypothetical protein